MNRNYLAGPQSDAINAVLTAAGDNFRLLLLNWLRLLFCLIAILILPANPAQ